MTSSEGGAGPDLGLSGTSFPGHADPSWHLGAAWPQKRRQEQSGAVWEWVIPHQGNKSQPQEPWMGVHGVVATPGPHLWVSYPRHNAHVIVTGALGADPKSQTQKLGR